MGFVQIFFFALQMGASDSVAAPQTVYDYLELVGPSAQCYVLEGPSAEQRELIGPSAQHYIVEGPSAEYLQVEGPSARQYPLVGGTAR